MSQMQKNHVTALDMGLGMEITEKFLNHLEINENLLNIYEKVITNTHKHDALNTIFHQTQWIYF